MREKPPVALNRFLLNPDLKAEQIVSVIPTLPRSQIYVRIDNAF